MIVTQVPITGCMQIKKTEKKHDNNKFPLANNP